MATRTLEIVLAGDHSSASRSFRKVEQDADRMGKKLDREGGRVRGFATVTSKGFGRVGLAAGGMAAAGAGAAALLAKSFVSGASDIDESLSKNQRLFGEHAATIGRWSKTTAQSLGISRMEALQSAGAFGSLFETIGLADKPAAQMSKRFVTLAADLASFHNATPVEALEALRSGLVGEAEPMRRFGALLSETRVKQEAWRTGIAKSGAELTEQQKVQARYQLILKDTSQSHGDATKTGGMFAGQMRRLKAQVSDTGAEFGRKLIPAALATIKAINSLFDSSTSGGRAISAVGRAAQTAGGWIKNAYGDATRAVTRWVNQNREELETAVRAFRNLGRAVRFVFEEVILPIVRTAVRRLVPILDSVKDTISGLVRFVTNVLTGQWSEAWDAAKDTVSGVLRTIKNLIVGWHDVLFTAVKALGGTIIKGLVAGLKGLPGAIKNAVVSGIKAGLNAAKNAVKGAAEDVGSFLLGPLGDGVGKAIGDGVGKTFSAPGLGGAGGLRGADPDLAPFAAIGSRYGLSVTSGIRPGDTTLSGNVSYHSSGDAIDMGGSMSGMRRFAGALYRTAGPRLRELISPFSELGIKDGRPFRYSGAIQEQHSGSNAHVHVAYTGPFGDGIGQAAAAGRAAGWRGSDLVTAVAIAGPESGYRNAARLVTSQEDSRGMWQINTLAHPWARGLNLQNPNVAARAAYRVWREAGGFGPWTAFSSGSYRGFMGQARSAVRGNRPAAAGGGGGGGGGGGPSAGPPVLNIGGPGNQAYAQDPGNRSAPGMAEQLAGVGVAKARAERDDSLPKLVAALVEERKIKRRRLKRVRKLLRRRKRRGKSLTALLNEQAELITDIGDLSEAIREYRADAAGGATTITRADELEAGVDPTVAEPADTGGAGGGQETGPDPAAELMARLLEERNVLDKQLIAEMQANRRLVETQGPSIMAALAAWLNGSIGGDLGLGGMQAAGTPGLLARH